MLRPISRFSLGFDVIGSVIGFLLTVPFSFAFFGSGQTVSVWLGDQIGSIVATLVVGALMWGSAAIARLSPPLALAVAWAGAVAQMIFGLWPGALNLPVFLVLYATSAWGSRLVMWLGAGSAALGGIIAGGYLALVAFVQANALYGTSGLSQIVVMGVLLAVTGVLALEMSWGAGLLWRMALRSRRIRADQLRAEERAGEEQERVRIARDMHDIVAHSLAVVIAQADGARYAADPAVTQEALGTIAQTARGALSDVRMLLTQLRHRQGDGPQPTLADLETLFAHVRQSGIEPRVTVDPMPPSEVAGAIQLAVYRILQEALTNAIRHGRGDVDVRLSWWPDRVDIEVRNAAVAGIPGAVQGPGGHGLVGMRERAQLVGGTLFAGADAGTFVVRATLPLTEMNGGQA